MLSNVSPKMLAGIGFFIIGHICAWFQLNSQFVWEWWRDKPLLAVGIYSVPVGLSFWMATRLIFEETGLLTWVLLNESMLTPKTLTCIALSCMILAVQVFWR